MHVPQTPLYAALTATIGKWGPVNLFDANEQGLWLDPADFYRYIEYKAENILPEGAFDAVGAWALTGLTEWSITGGKMIKNGTTTSGGPRYEADIGLRAGKHYEITFKVDAVAGGSVAVQLHDPAGTSVVSAQGTAPGLWRSVVTCASNAARVRVVSNISAATFTVDYVEIREVVLASPASMFQDSNGQLPVVAVEQPVGLIYDKRFWYERGPEQAAAAYATPTAAGYNNQTITDSPTEFHQVAGTTAGRTYINITHTPGSNIEVTARVVSVTTGSVTVFGRDQPSGVGSAIGQSAAGTAGQWIKVSYRATTASGSVLFVTSAAGAACRVDNISIREVFGNHAYQTTTAARPTLSARKNLFTNTQTFMNPGWTWPASVVDDGVRMAPDGSMTARRLYPTASGSHNLEYYGNGYSIPVGCPVTNSYYVKSDGLSRVAIWFPNTGASVTFDLVAGTKLADAVSGTGKIESIGDGWYRISATYTQATTAGASARLYLVEPGTTGAAAWTTAGNSTQGVLVWQPQSELGTTAGPYQWVRTATDYDWYGWPLYLRFDGTDDRFSIPGLNATMDDLESWRCTAVLRRRRVVANNWPRLLYRVINAAGQPRSETSFLFNPSETVAVERWVNGNLAGSSGATTVKTGHLTMLSGGFDGTIVNTKNETMGTSVSSSTGVQSIGNGVQVDVTIGQGSFDVDLYGLVLLAGRYPTAAEQTKTSANFIERTEL